MALNRSRMRSELPDTAHLKRLLHKIIFEYGQKSTRLVFQSAGVRVNASQCANVTLDETLGSGNIVFRRAPYVAVKAERTLADLKYVADTAGTAGNSITVQYVNDGTAGSETVGVVGTAITVHMQSGVSTATQIKAAIDGAAPAAALVDVTIVGTGSNAQVTTAISSLSGGLAQAALETYDLADIEIVKRLRTKKWLIVIKDAANPA